MGLLIFLAIVGVLLAILAYAGLKDPEQPEVGAQSYEVVAFLICREKNQKYYEIFASPRHWAELHMAFFDDASAYLDRGNGERQIVDADYCTRDSVKGCLRALARDIATFSPPRASLTGLLEDIERRLQPDAQWVDDLSGLRRHFEMLEGNDLESLIEARLTRQIIEIVRTAQQLDSVAGSNRRNLQVDKVGLTSTTGFKSHDLNLVDPGVAYSNKNPMSKVLEVEHTAASGLLEDRIVAKTSLTEIVAGDVMPKASNSASHLHKINTTRQKTQLISTTGKLGEARTGLREIEERLRGHFKDVEARAQNTETLPKAPSLRLDPVAEPLSIGSRSSPIVCLGRVLGLKMKLTCPVDNLLLFEVDPQAYERDFDNADLMRIRAVTMSCYAKACVLMESQSIRDILHVGGSSDHDSATEMERDEAEHEKRVVSRLRGVLSRLSQQQVDHISLAVACIGHRNFYKVADDLLGLSRSYSALVTTIEARIKHVNNAYATQKENILRRKEQYWHYAQLPLAGFAAFELVDKVVRPYLILKQCDFNSLIESLARKSTEEAAACDFHQSELITSSIALVLFFLFVVIAYLWRPSGRGEEASE